MVTTIILAFFGVSSLASVIVFAACAASARADQIQREAFSGLYEEAEHLMSEKRKTVVGNNQLALNP